MPRAADRIGQAGVIRVFRPLGRAVPCCAFCHPCCGPPAASACHHRKPVFQHCSHTGSRLRYPPTGLAPAMCSRLVYTTVCTLPAHTPSVTCASCLHRSIGCCSPAGGRPVQDTPGARIPQFSGREGSHRSAVARPEQGLRRCTLATSCGRASPEVDAFSRDPWRSCVCSCGGASDAPADGAIAARASVDCTCERWTPCASRLRAIRWLAPAVLISGLPERMGGAAAGDRFAHSTSPWSWSHVASERRLFVSVQARIVPGCGVARSLFYGCCACGRTPRVLAAASALLNWQISVVVEPARCGRSRHRCPSTAIGEPAQSPPSLSRQPGQPAKIVSVPQTSAGVLALTRMAWLSLCMWTSGNCNTRSQEWCWLQGTIRRRWHEPVCRNCRYTWLGIQFSFLRR